MINIQNIIGNLNSIEAKATEVSEAWTAVLDAELLAELDGEGVFSDCVRDLSKRCVETARLLSETAKVPFKRAKRVKIDLHDYHTNEYFTGDVVGSDGEITDMQAYYCDQYKVHKKLARLFNDRSGEALALAQGVIESYQSGVAEWSDDTADLVLGTVQPILDAVGEFSDLCLQIGGWHEEEADRNINQFMAG